MQSDVVVPTASTPARGAFWAGLVSVAAMAVLYVLTPVANFTDAKDSLRYANRLVEHRPDFHPNHLIYEPLNYVFWRVGEAIAGPLEPLHVMQGFSIFCAIPFLFCVYLLTWRGRRNAAVAGLATCVVGLCFGVWVYSVSPDGYLPPLALALVALVLLDPQNWQHRSARLPLGLLIGAALLTAAAVLIHQMYVFFAIVAGCVLLVRAEFGDLGARVRSFALYGAISGGVVFVSYLAAHRLIVDTDLPLLDWARGFARDNLYFGDPPSLLSPIKGGVGAISSMLTMNGLMGVEPVAERMVAVFPNKSLYEESYIAEMAIPVWMRWPILLAMVGAVLLWLVMAGQSVLARRIRAPGYVDVVLWVAVLLYAVLVIIWEPTNREFWIQTYVFATLWCARQFARLTRGRLLAMGGLVICLFTVNFFAALKPLSDPRTDYWRMYNAEVLARPGEFDLVITSCSWLCGWYIRYFARARAISPAAEELAVLQARIDAAGADRVLISSLAYDPHPLAFAHAQRAFDPARIAAFRAAYPPPDDRPTSHARQVFYRLQDGKLVPLAP